MNEKTNQILRAWFFTNERINYFLKEIEKEKEIKKVFTIGGGGDFAFSILSSFAFNKLDEIFVCDIRPLAIATIDFKSALFRGLEYKKILDFFLKPKCLKNTDLWYRHSFWQIKHKTEYLPYLTSEKNYQLLQKRLNKISLYCGDIKDNLKLSKNNYYDLIYISNILDNKKYCQRQELYLETIKNKLNKNGLLLVVTQNSCKKTIKLVEREGFYLYSKKPHNFNIFSELLGHYSFSFLLFKKNIS